MPGVQPFCLDMFGKVAMTGEPIHFEKYNRSLRKYLEVSAFTWSKGQFACVFSDITERKRAEKVIEATNAQLRDKNRQLADLSEHAQTFVDNVSHEFRTPLAVIKEFTAILAEGLGGPITEDQAKYLNMMGASVHDLAQMVDDLLDTSRLKAGTLRVDRHRCNVHELVDSVLPMVQSKAMSRNIRLSKEIAPDLPDVFADGEKIERVLSNLIVNAIKFSAETTEVKVWARASDEGVRIGVTDQGPGISDEDMKLIFERFKQTKPSNGSRLGGFGLGLSIARSLISLNLGRIEVESSLGEGSTFSFAIPTCDWQILLDAYLRSLDIGHDNGLVSVLEIVPVNGDSLSQVHDFLTSICRPSDLILSDETGRRLIALGLTEDPQGWAQRIQDVRAYYMKVDSFLQIPEIRISTTGSWPRGERRERLLAQVLEQISSGGSNA